eukprot:jgi/Mesvir1/5217/Mv15346-RA.1
MPRTRVTPAEPAARGSPPAILRSGLLLVVGMAVLLPLLALRTWVLPWYFTEPTTSSVGHLIRRADGFKIDPSKVTIVTDLGGDDDGDSFHSSPDALTALDAARFQSKTTRDRQPSSAHPWASAARERVAAALDDDPDDVDGAREEEEEESFVRILASSVLGRDVGELRPDPDILTADASSSEGEEDEDEGGTGDQVPDDSIMKPDPWQQGHVAQDTSLVADSPGADASSDAHHDSDALSIDSVVDPFQQSGDALSAVTGADSVTDASESTFSDPYPSTALDDDVNDNDEDDGSPFSAMAVSSTSTKKGPGEKSQGAKTGGIWGWASSPRGAKTSATTSKATPAGGPKRKPPARLPLGFYHCPSDCLGHGVCHHPTGTCHCEQDRMGPDCSLLFFHRKLRPCGHSYPPFPSSPAKAPSGALDQGADAGSSTNGGDDDRNNDSPGAGVDKESLCAGDLPLRLCPKSCNDHGYCVAAPIAMLDPATGELPRMPPGHEEDPPYPWGGVKNQKPKRIGGFYDISEGPSSPLDYVMAKVEEVKTHRRSIAAACVCDTGYGGADCGTLVTPQGKGVCVNDCQGHGTCLWGFCLCQPGYWGLDCAESLPGLATGASTSGAPRKGRATAAAGGGGGRGGESSSSAPGSPSPQGPRPRIYMYDLHPKFTTYQFREKAGHFGLRLNASHGFGNIYAMERRLTAAMLHSPYREMDPDKADFFFVPMWDVIDPFQHFNHFRGLVKHLQKLGKYFDQRPQDHIFPIHRDFGSCGAPSELHNSIFVTHWGGPLGMSSAKGRGWWSSRRCFQAGLDIVVPPPLDFGIERALAIHGPLVLPKSDGSKTGGGRGADARRSSSSVAASGGGDGGGTWGGLDAYTRFVRKGKQEAKPPARDTIFFFSGKVCWNLKEDFSVDIPLAENETCSDSKHFYHRYSFGVRKAVYDLYRRTQGFRVIDSGERKLHPPELRREMERAVFCLAASGWGWGTRTYEAMVSGCIPVIIQDDGKRPPVHVAFQNHLPWEEFSVRIWRRDIPRLESLLRGMSPTEVAAKQQALARVWTRMVWPAAAMPPPGWSPSGRPLETPGGAGGVRAGKPGGSRAAGVDVQPGTVGLPVGTLGVALGAKSGHTPVYDFLPGPDAFQTLMDVLRERAVARDRGKKTREGEPLRDVWGHTLLPLSGKAAAAATAAAATTAVGAGPGPGAGAGPGVVAGAGPTARVAATTKATTVPVGAVAKPVAVAQQAPAPRAARTGTTSVAATAKTRRTEATASTTTPAATRTLPATAPAAGVATPKTMAVAAGRAAASRRAPAMEVVKVTIPASRPTGSLGQASMGAAAGTQSAPAAVGTRAKAAPAQVATRAAPAQGATRAARAARSEESARGTTAARQPARTTPAGGVMPAG